MSRSARTILRGGLRRRLQLVRRKKAWIGMWHFPARSIQAARSEGALPADRRPPELEDRAVKRYNKKFPDPVFGSLDLGHASFAADAYWNMVQEIHRLTGVDAGVFHRHYNLKPWFDEGNRRSYTTSPFGIATHFRRTVSWVRTPSKTSSRCDSLVS